MHEIVCIPDKMYPRTSKICLCGATGTRRSRVFVGSFLDHFRTLFGSRNVNGITRGTGGRVSDGILKEVSHEMPF